MGLWQSVMQGLSDAKKPLSPADPSHKTLFIELAMLAILVLCLPFVIWWIWGCINNLGRWKVTDDSKTDRKHYIKTWHGFTEREKIDRRKQKRKEVREKIRSMFVWKTTRADYSWIFWDPDGSKKAKVEEERNSTWLRHLPCWMRSRGYGSLRLMRGGNLDRLADAEKGLIQSRPFHNPDEIRLSHPFDIDQLHQTARLNALQVDGTERGTCALRTGIAMDGAMDDAMDGSSIIVSTICRRRLPQGTSRVFAAESAETNRAVQLQLFMSKKGHECEEEPIPFHETLALPESISSFDVITPEGCIDLQERSTPEECIAYHEPLPSRNDDAHQGASALLEGVILEESIADDGLSSPGDEYALLATSNLPRGVTPELRIADDALLSSQDEHALQGTPTLPGSILPEKCTSVDDAALWVPSTLPGDFTIDEHLVDQEGLSSGDGAALHRTSTLSGSIEIPENITLYESHDQQSAMLQSIPSKILYLDPHLPVLMNNVIRVNEFTELSPAAADQLEQQLKSAWVQKHHPSHAAQQTERTRDSFDSEDTISFTSSIAWKKREAASLDTSSRSSQSSMPSQLSLYPPRTRPHPNAHVGRVLDDLRTKRQRPARTQKIAIRNGSHWSTLESPEVEHYSPPRPTPVVRFHHPPDSDTRPHSVADMIRKFRESSVSYHRDASHSRIHPISDASEAAIAATRSPPTQVPQRTYGSIKISKLRNTIRAASARLRKTTTLSKRTPTLHTIREVSIEAATSAADSGEWDLDWDPEVYQRGWEAQQEEELARMGKGRDSLSTTYKKILERVLRRKSSSGARKNSSGRTPSSK